VLYLKLKQTSTYSSESLLLLPELLPEEPLLDPEDLDPELDLEEPPDLPCEEDLPEFWLPPLLSLRVAMFNFLGLKRKNAQKTTAIMPKC
jgi:hypothetical protein